MAEGKRIMKQSGQVRGVSYDRASTARKLNQQEQTRRRQERAYRQEAAQPKVQIREKGEASVFAVLGFVALAIVSVMLVMSYVQLTRASDEVLALQQEVSDLKAEEVALRAEMAFVYDPNRIEQELVGSGAMIRPQPEQICYVDLSEPDQVELYAAAETGEGLGGSLRALAASVLEYFR